MFLPVGTQHRAPAPAGLRDKDGLGTWPARTSRSLPWGLAPGAFCFCLGRGWGSVGVKEAAQELLGACLGHAAHAARVPQVINHLLERPADCGRAREGPGLDLPLSLCGQHLVGPGRSSSVPFLRAPETSAVTSRLPRGGCSPVSAERALGALSWGLSSRALAEASKPCSCDLQ